MMLARRACAAQVRWSSGAIGFSNPKSHWFTTQKEILKNNVLVPKQGWRPVETQRVKFNVPAEWHVSTDAQDGVAIYTVNPKGTIMLKGATNGIMIVAQQGHPQFNDERAAIQGACTSPTKEFEYFNDIDLPGTYGALRSIENGVECEGLVKAIVTPETIAMAWCLTYVDIPAAHPDRAALASILVSLSAA